tara:strand:- start:10032 stop:10196 length:165 start_codon:yes stop_codon:yes gene_type:complete
MQDTIKAKRANSFLRKAFLELKSIETTNLKIDLITEKMESNLKNIQFEIETLKL